MANKYPNSGALFESHNRVHAKSPDMSGDISIDRTLLRTMLNETDEDDIKIKLSAWRKQGSKGEFLSLTVNTYKPQNVQPAPPPIDDSDLPF